MVTKVLKQNYRINFNESTKMDPLCGIAIGFGAIIGLGCLCSRECFGECNKPDSSQLAQISLHNQKLAELTATQPK